MDLCGPMRVQTINGKKYILVIIDDYSRFTWVKFLRSNDETPTVVIKFLKQIQVGLNKTVRFIRSSTNGTKFVNKTLFELNLKSVGIFHQKTVPRTPTAERRCRKTEPNSCRGSSDNANLLKGTDVSLGLEAVATAFEPKNFTSAVTEDYWFQAMQEEIHEFDRLDVWELVPPPDNANCLCSQKTVEPDLVFAMCNVSLVSRKVTAMAITASADDSCKFRTLSASTYGRCSVPW
ncbi:retrovirus-related pol polyprotein from transposon TNT 1-94 [Tanacetum coccineum]